MKKIVGSKIVKNLFFFILLLFLTFWFIFRKQNMNSLFKTIKSADIRYIVLGAFLMLGYHLTEAINIRGILSKLGEKRMSILKALKFTFIGFFFSSITPAATGGQPLEIYFMTKENISGAKATMSSLIMLCGFQISTISIGLICALTNPHLLSGGLIWFFLLGVTINGIALSLLLIGIFSERLTKKLVSLASRIMKFFRVKNVDNKISNIEATLERYIECSKFIKSHRKTFIKAIFTEFIQIGFYFSVPFCIYKAFGFNSLNYFELFAMQAVLFTTVSGLPLPGAVGVSEAVFLSIFEGAFGSSYISGAMLLSRGVTFYLYVVISLNVVIYNSIRTKNFKGVADEVFIEYKTDDDIFEQ